MINQFFLMDGNGLYVWSAFIFTIFCFFSLYFVTKFQLIREQRRFVKKFGSLSEEKIKIAKVQKINKEILVSVANSNF